MRTHYETLGVSSQAEDVVIDAAYRALMKRYHPDAARPGEAGDDTQAKEINEAYRVLKDPKLRAAYDQKLASGPGYSARHGHPEGQQRAEFAADAHPVVERRGGGLVSLAFIALSAVVMVGGVGSLAVRSGATVADDSAGSVTPVSSVQPVGLSSIPPSDPIEASSEYTSSVQSGAPSSDELDQGSSAQSQEQTYDLGSVTPENQPALRASINHALNTGQTTPWQSPDGELSGDVQVGRAVFEAGKICRSLRFTITRGAQELNAAEQVACIAPGHHWMRSDPAPSLANNNNVPPF